MKLNPWVEYVSATYRDARDAWELRFETECNRTYRPGLIAQERRKARRGGRREVTDFVDDNPPPMYRDFLKGLAQEAA